MKKTTFTTLISLSLVSFAISAPSASAFSFKLEAAPEAEKSGMIERFIDTLFQNTSKTGAALFGEVESVSTSTLSLSVKQKLYSLIVSDETKVRKLGNVPGVIEDVKEGDKVSVVSTPVKGEPGKLRAKIVKIISIDDRKEEKKEEIKDEETKESHENELEKKHEEEGEKVSRSLKAEKKEIGEKVEVEARSRKVTR